MTRGVFIVFCGINGSGKTTLINNLIYRLNSEDENNKTSIMLWKQAKCPDRSTPIGKKIDEILKGTLKVDKHIELKFFSDNRKEVAKEILTKLNNGINVLCDRYLYCNVAYTLASQTLQLKSYNHVDLIGINNIIAYDKGIIKPDCVFLVMGDYLHLRNETQEKYHISDKSFHDLLTNNYILSFIHTNSNFIIIDNKKDKLEATIIHLIERIYEIQTQFKNKPIDNIK